MVGLALYLAFLWNHSDLFCSNCSSCVPNLSFLPFFASFNPNRNHNLNISTERQIKTPAPFWLHSQLPVNVPFENNLFSGMRITCFGNKSSAQAAENETSPYLYPSTFSQRICAIHKNGPWGFRMYGFPYIYREISCLIECDWKKFNLISYLQAFVCWFKSRAKKGSGVLYVRP